MPSGDTLVLAHPRQRVHQSPDIAAATEVVASEAVLGEVGKLVGGLP